MTQGLQLATGAEEILPGVRCALADLLEQVDPVAPGERDVEVGNPEPLPAHEGVVLGERVPVAVLLGEVVTNVRDVDEGGLEEPGIVHLEAHDVVAGLRHQLGRELAHHLHALDVIDAHVRVGVLGESLAQLGKLGVRRRRVVHRGEERQLARGAAGGGWSAGEQSSAGQRAAARAKERATTDSKSTIPGHDEPPRAKRWWG